MGFHAPGVALGRPCSINYFLVLRMVKDFEQVVSVSGRIYFLGENSKKEQGARKNPGARGKIKKDQGAQKN